MIIAPVTVEVGPVRQSSPSNSTTQSPGRAPVVNDDVGEIDQLLARRMGWRGLFTMGAGNNGDDGKPSLLRAPRHFHRHGPDSAG